MKNFKSLVAIFSMLVSAASAFASGSHGGAHTTKDAPQKETAKPVAAAATSAEMADGEVRKVDKENKKVTLKHGLIKNLDMPGMTMVFQVKDAALLDNLKAGDKVKFKAEQAGSAIVVTDIQAAK